MKKTIGPVFLAFVWLTVLLTGCTAPKATPIPPTATPVPPTDTPTGEWTAYTVTDPNRKPNEGLPDQWINQIFARGDGKVLVSTREAIANFDANGWHTVYDLSKINPWPYWGFTAAPDGTIWLGNTNILGRFDGAAWTWFGSAYLAADYAQSEPFTTVEDIPSFGAIQALVADSKGTLWAATDAGLLRVEGEAWTVFRISDGLISNKIFTLAVASDDDLWVGTDAGLSKFDGEGWSSYPRPGLFSLGIDFLAVATDGIVWGGHIDEGEFWWFDGQHWGSLSIPEELDIGVVWSLATGPGRTIWFGSLKGLTQYDGTRWAHYPLDENMLPSRVDLNAPGCVALAAAPDGTIWCGTQRGLLSFRPPR
jgi:ligand-binding sensor domain-containing protein